MGVIQLRTRNGGITLLERGGLDVEKDAETPSGVSRIRCPYCHWQPANDSRWCCYPMGGPPEFFNGGCGTWWNTFDTRGLGLGCFYRWRHTWCLSCNRPALHEDWYEGQQRQQ